MRGSVLLFLTLLLALAACGQEAPAENNAARGAISNGDLKIVATTTIIGDVVQRIAGDDAVVTVLIPVGTDPHAFQPRPQDIAALTDADVVFINGLGLEAFLEPMLENAGGAARVVALSDQIVALEAEENEEEEGHEHEGQNPHVWLDPNNVILWSEQIEKTLGELVPAQAANYTANADAYRLEIQELDGWIAEQVETVPVERRQLVTDHEIFGYFAARYGFEQVGAVIPSLSTTAEPSAQEMAALQDAVRLHEVPAIFMSTTVSQPLANSVAADTGTELLTLYTDSLSGPNGPAASYITLMRYNVTTIVEALR